jgi:hypothetical protein
MTLEQLRKEITDGICAMAVGHISEECDKLGLPPLPDTVEENESWSGAKNYTLSRLELMSVDDTLILAETVARRLKLADLLDEIFEMQDAEMPALDEVCRRQIADLYPDGSTIAGARSMESFFGEMHASTPFNMRWWALDAGWDRGRFDDYEVGHCNTLFLFENIKAFGWSRRRFISLIETSLEPRSRAADKAAALKDRLISVLSRHGWTLVNQGPDEADPEYRIVPLRRAVAGGVKNLVFASAGPKLEFGLYDAISNDIEILSGAEHCLIYRKQPPKTGLLWRHLIEWWAELHGLDEKETRASIGDRLVESLDSEAEKNCSWAISELFATGLAPTCQPSFPRSICTTIPRRSASSAATGATRVSAWTS